MQIDRIHFYVENAKRWRDWFVQVMGLSQIASSSDGHTHTEVVSSGSQVTFVLSSPLTGASPAAQFLGSHPPGVIDIALAVEDLEAIVSKVRESGIQASIEQQAFPQGRMRWSQIAGVGHLLHTLVERKGVTPVLPQSVGGFPVQAQPWGGQKSSVGKAVFSDIDHTVLNVAAGQLGPTVSWYEAVLGFKRQQTFTIRTEQSGLYSEVLVHPKTGLQIPVNEPLSANSQIQEFLDLNRGPGVQHIALTTPNIARVTKHLRTAGLAFLAVPPSYYRQLPQTYPALNLSAQEWEEIVTQEILVDCQDRIDSITNLTPRLQPLLLQIFTQPIFTQPTFFFELIERRSQAQGFGEGNFRALFEAIEQEQLKRSHSADVKEIPSSHDGASSDFLNNEFD